jgi:hypothetical protein
MAALGCPWTSTGGGRAEPAVPLRRFGQTDRRCAASAVFDNPRFAGGPFSFWNRQAVPLTPTGVKLVNGNSLFRTCVRRGRGPANFVNGLYLAGSSSLQADASSRSTSTATICASPGPSRSRRPLPAQHPPGVGWDYGIGLRWRPFLDRRLIEAGAAGFERDRASATSTPQLLHRLRREASRLYQSFASLVAY